MTFLDGLGYAIIAAVLAGLAAFLGVQVHAGQAWWLSDIMMFPLAAGLIVMALPDRHAKHIKHISLVFAACSMALSFFLGWDYLNHDGPLYRYTELVAWVPGLGVSYSLAADGISVAMLVLTGIIIFTGVLASWTVTNRAKEFFALLLVLVTGVFGVFVAQDLFLFFLFYEVAVLPMYLLIGIWGTGRKEYSAMKLTLYLLAGSALMLVAFLAMYFGTGKTTFALEALKAAAFPESFQRFFFPFLFIGFGVLAAFWPLHTWSPDGHASAPTAVSMLHAGVLMKLGAFGIIRIGVEILPQGAHFWLPIFALFTLVNITYGAFSALSQTDLKYVTAYSSVSHMGIVILGICTMTDAGINGAVLQMFSHGIMTGLFFALIGFTYEKTHTRIFGDFGGLGRKIPVLATFFTLGGLASLGLPGMSGFVAEFMVFTGAWQFNPVVAVIAAVGIVVTAAYVLRMLQKSFWGPITNPHYEELTDASKVQILCLAILAGTLIVVGLYPWPLVKLINTGVAPVLARLQAVG